jgi:hypothetical protein
MIGASRVNLTLVNADQKMRWMSQWQSAGLELEKVRTRELRELSEESSAELFNRCAIPAADVWISPERAESSGLVEQQAIFMRSRSHASCY